MSEPDKVSERTRGRPYRVNTKGLFGAIIQSGPFEGLPFALAATVSSGMVPLEDVHRLGWETMDE